MRLVVVAALALLSACAEQPQEEQNTATVATAGAEREQRELTNAMLRDGVDPRQNLTVTDPPEAQVGTPLGTLPPAGRALRFVGRWATEQGNCANLAWRFTGASLDTPAGSQCRFTNVRKVPGGYDIAARCTAEGPPTDDRITLRFAESARAMLFESDAIADAGLVYCGD